MTNKDEIKSALVILGSYECPIGAPAWVEHVDTYDQTPYESTEEAAQAHLELLELGVTLEDIKALLEARDGFGTVLTRAKAIEAIISKWGKAPQDTKED